MTIKGQIDVFIKDATRTIGIIEIKTRTNGFFGISKLIHNNYDLDQLSVYYLLTERMHLEIFVLCEYFNGEIMIHKFTKQDMIKRWNDLSVKLIKVPSKIKYINDNINQDWIMDYMENEENIISH